ncbi:MAG TPA: O-antigen ligase family protein [Steroidobacteraceae bacterium]|nr:O-antigen ligase family protein [Steroidobacteraceae bacterium]
MNFYSLKFFALLATCGVLLAVFASAQVMAAGGALIAVLGMLVAVAIAARLLRPAHYVLTSLEIAWLLFIAALFFATILANLKLSYLDGAMQFRLFFMLVLWSVWLFVVPTLVRDVVALEGAVRAFDAFGIMVSASVFLPIVAGVGEAQGAESALGRVFGPFGDPVPFVVALFACRALVAGRWPQLAFHLTALLVTVGLGASLTLLVAFAAHFLLPWRARSNVRKPLGRRLLLAVLFAPVVIAVVALFAPRIVGRVLDPVLMATTLASRFGSFNVAADIIANHPVAGVGLNGFTAVADNIGAEAFFVGRFNTNFIVNAANQTLQTLTDAGIFGFTAFVVFCVLLYKRLSWAANHSPVDRPAFRAYQIWLVGILIGNQTAVWMQPISPVSMCLFFVGGLALAASRIAARPAGIVAQ